MQPIHLTYKKLWKSLQNAIIHYCVFLSSVDGVPKIITLSVYRHCLSNEKDGYSMLRVSELQVFIISKNVYKMQNFFTFCVHCGVLS